MDYYQTPAASAASGDPNRENQPNWPLYDESSEPYREFRDSLRAGRHLLKAECDLFDEYFRAKRSRES